MASTSAAMPLGFRFEPTDRELISHYLRKMLNGEPLLGFAIPIADVYAREPWTLDWDDSVKPFIKNNERYFFARREKMSLNGNGKRPRRSLDNKDGGGRRWWKANTGDQSIFDSNKRVIGFKKTLTFFRAKNGKKNGSEFEKTDYIMHEYMLGEEGFQEWTLCRIKYNGKDKDEVDAFAGYYPTDQKSHRSSGSIVTAAINVDGGRDISNQDVDQDFVASLEQQLEHEEELDSGGGSVGCCPVAPAEGGGHMDGNVAAGATELEGGMNGEKERLSNDINVYGEELAALLQPFEGGYQQNLWDLFK